MARRILFFAEAVTLAHVARPLALAEGLGEDWEVHLACAPGYAHFVRAPWKRHSLGSISSAAFLAALAKGRPLYDIATLNRYVQEDLALLARVKPDVVVGDFRLSLSVSARKAGVPYLNITNAYWSPYAKIDYPAPEHPLVKVFGPFLATALFRLARPLIFAMHARPLNALRKQYGLAPLPADVRYTYTDADQVLYADVPDFIPMEGLPAHHHFLGPVLWNPPVARPPWWEEATSKGPWVYLTLGSSGKTELLHRLLQVLQEFDFPVVVATAGRAGSLPAGIYAADYLPGLEACRRARLVICNGGSPTCQQALAAGVPILGLPSNLDQFLNMQAVATQGAGVLVRSDHAGVLNLRKTLTELLNKPEYGNRARSMAAVYARYSATQRFAERVALV